MTKQFKDDPDCYTCGEELIYAEPKNGTCGKCHGPFCQPAFTVTYKYRDEAIEEEVGFTTIEGAREFKGNLNEEMLEFIEIIDKDENVIE